jgi:hypothetical protein
LKIDLCIWWRFIQSLAALTGAPLADVLVFVSASEARIALGRNIGNQAAFQKGDLIFEQELAPFQAPKAQFVQFLVVRQAFYHFIEIAVFDPQHFNFCAYYCGFFDCQIHGRPRWCGIFSCFIAPDSG